MIKGKIAGIKTFDSSIVIRIKIDQKTRKRYMQLRQKLADRYHTSPQAYRGGFTKLLGNGVDINIFKGEEYIFIVVYGENRRSVLSVISENFEFMK